MVQKIIFTLWIAFTTVPVFASDLYQQLFLAPEQLNTRLLLPSASERITNNFPNPTLPDFSPPLAEKSRGKAFMLSLLMPGIGQHYVNGASLSARIFIAVEAGLWASVIGFHTYGNWRKEDYQTFAAAHAQANINGKDHTYFVNLGNFISLEAYNAAKLRDRNLPQYYRDTEKYYWAWDSDENRSRFYDMRIASDQAFDRVKFAAAGVFVNHIVSAIMAMWSANKYNKKIQTGSQSFDIHFSAAYDNASVRLAFSRTLP